MIHQFTAPTATVYNANQQVCTLKCRTLHCRTAQSAMPTSMLQPAKVLGEVDEGTLLHELQKSVGDGFNRLFS